MKAERPANELEQAPQQQAASFEFVTAPPAAASVQTGSTSGAAQSETPGATTAGIKSETPALPVASGPGNPLNLLDSAADVQVAAAPPEPDAAAEFIDVDSLVTNPGSFQGRDIIVTGSVLRLLERYRLQSNSGPRGRFLRSGLWGGKQAFNPYGGRFQKPGALNLLEKIGFVSQNRLVKFY